MNVAHAHAGKTIARRRGDRGLRRWPDDRPNGVAGLGAKLRSAREKNGLSLRALARSVDVSPSLISQIEHGTVVPSVGTLYAMVTELGLGLDELFQNKPKAASNGRRMSTRKPAGPVCRRNNREVIRLADGVRWELLTPAPDPELEFFYVVYEPGAESCEEDKLVRHGGMEYAYLISGRLGIRIGSDKYVLNPGDSISFDAQEPHRLWTAGNKPAVAIWAVLNRSQDTRTSRTKSTIAIKQQPRAGKGRR